MRYSLLALSSLLLASCGAPDDIEYNDDGVVKAQKVGTQLIQTQLHRHNGRNFSPVQIHQEPRYYILYYSASW